MVDPAPAPCATPSLAPRNALPHPDQHGHRDDSKVVATGAADVWRQGADVVGGDSRPVVAARGFIPGHVPRREIRTSPSRTSDGIRSGRPAFPRRAPNRLA